MTTHPLVLSGGPPQEIDRPDGVPREQGVLAKLYPLVCQYVGPLSQKGTWVRDFVAKIRIYHFYGPVDFGETGFHGSGEDAIGLIVMPSVQTKDSSVFKMIQRIVEDPEALNVAWGHTALYVRKGGKIELALGFGPHGNVLAVADELIKGTGSITGRIHDDYAMLNMVEARTVEFPLDGRDADEVIKAIREYKTPFNMFYVTQPSGHIEKNAKNLEYTNCLKWAIERIEGVMKAQLMSSVPDIRILDLGPSRTTVIGASSQGRLFQDVIYVSENQGSALVLKSDTEDMFEINNRRVAGRFPQKLRILYAARTLFLVSGVAYFGYQHAYPNLALPNTRNHAIAVGALSVAGTALHQKVIAEAKQVYENITEANFVPVMKRAGVLGSSAVIFFAPGAIGGMLFWIVAGMSLYMLFNLIAHAMEGFREPPKLRKH
jgi:hypothetical protein